MEATGDFTAWLTHSGLTADGLILGAGVLLLVVGSRHYRLALVIPAAVLGMMIVDIVVGSDLPPMSRFVASLVGALVVGIVASLLESIAVRLAGALLGGSLAQTIWPVVMTGGSVTPWWVPFLGAAIGLLMFPGLYRAMLRVVIPLLGGLLVAQGLGHPGDPQIVFGLAGGSFLVDTLLRFRVKT